VLAAAMQLGCEALVTGDRTHFGAFYGKTFGGVKIHSPRSLAEAVLKIGLIGLIGVGPRQHLDPLD
jgi:hypothetical protein